jgi:PAS domain S-box-containing protein
VRCTKAFFYPVAVEKTEEAAMTNHRKMTKSELIGALETLESRQRQAEQALAESEARYRHLLETVHEQGGMSQSVVEQSWDGIVLVDRRGCIIEWNHSEEEITGLKREQVLGETIWQILVQLVPIEARTLTLSQEIRAVVEQALEAEQVPWFNQVLTIELQRPDGTRRMVESIVYPIRIGAQSLIGSFSRDITERVRAEQALREREEQYRLLFNNTPDAVMLTDPRGDILEANPAACAMLGWTEGELRRVGRTGIASGSDPRWEPAVGERDRTGQFRGELIYRRKDGTEFPGETSSGVFLDRDGRRRTTTIIRDVTERKRTEEDLRMFSRAMAQSPLSIIITNPAGDIEYVNPKFTEATGYTSSEVIGKNPRLLKSGETPPDEYQRLWDTITAGVTWQGVFQNRKKSGELYWESASISPILDPEGVVTHFLAVKEDITERKRAEEELRRRNQDLVTLNAIAGRISHSRTLQDVLAGMLDVVLGLTRREQGLILLLDENGGEPVLGALRGLPAESVDWLQPIWQSPPVTRALESGRTVTIPSSGPVEGPLPWVLSVAVPIRSKARVLGVLTLFGFQGRTLDAQNEQLLTMIGDQVGVALENTRLAEKAAVIEVWREIDRLRSEFVANVSHELRTPLGLIKLFTTALLGQDLNLAPETRQQFLVDIVEEADKLAQIVDNLIDISRQQDNRLRLSKRSTNLDQLIRDVVKTMAVQAGNHPLLYQGPPGPVMATVDRPSIVQVLRNLLSNAIKYSPQGGTVTIDLSEGPRQVIIQISDNGIGIPPEDLERVFDRFYRVPSEETHAVSGIGLGLSISRGIVEAHGGHIWVESILSTGSHFFVSLPHSDSPTPASDSPVSA